MKEIQSESEGDHQTNLINNNNNNSMISEEHPHSLITDNKTNNLT